MCCNSLLQFWTAHNGQGTIQIVRPGQQALDFDRNGSWVVFHLCLVPHDQFVQLGRTKWRYAMIFKQVCSVGGGSSVCVCVCGGGQCRRLQRVRS